MRRTTSMSRRASALAGVLLTLAIAAPAAAVTNLYAPHRDANGAGNVLAQFAVAADGSLSALAPAALGFGAQDIAITPDGRFAYVTRSAGTDAGAIDRYVRGAGGRMEPAGSIVTDPDPRSILVTPQGTHVFYALGSRGAVQSRPIGADGALGAAADTLVRGTAPRFLAMTPGGTSLYVADAAAPRVLQFDVATAALTPKAPASVAWPVVAGVPAPDGEAARLTLTPDARHLYAASGQSGTGIAHFDVGASGALGASSIVGVAGDLNGTSVTPVAPGGGQLWAPTSTGTPGRIDQFAIAATGALSALTPPSVPYALPAATRDAVAHPNGASLYTGQDANVGEWSIAPGGALSGRANRATGGATNAGLALSPSQAPVASFAVARGPAGQATLFDGRASSDPDGTIARYDWIFGDGTALANGGPTPGHRYAAAGTYAVTLTVTDADGTSTARLWTGSRMLRNGGPSAQSTQAVSIPAATARPEKGKSVTIVATQGTVRVKLRGSKRYVDVRLLREIPLGSRVDARKGRVRVTAEVDHKRARTQSAVFYDGIFDVQQTKGSEPILVAKLAGGSFAGCRPKSARSSSTGAAGFAAAAGLAGAAAQPFQFAAKKKAKRSKRKVRRLWGRGEGDFRTAGQRSSATVRGTWWLVEDRCDGTLTKVRQGRVDVRDLRLKKTIRLRAGKRFQYLAKAP
jgi:hypothetical protein